MGKLPAIHQRPNCTDGETAPICASECCNDVQAQFAPPGEPKGRRAVPLGKARASTEAGALADSEVKELLVVGAGPHALSLLLRLLEPDADLLSDKDRHLRAESRSQMRPISDVYRHLRKLSRGPSATLRRGRKAPPLDGGGPPPLSLGTVRDSVLVVDSHGGWLSGWKQNFEALGIKTLRSLMNAHADPFDHRSLEFYADASRAEELVPLPDLRQRDRDFRAPYLAPSAALFQDFHDLLARAYGIHDIVRKGTVRSIHPARDGQSGEPIFQAIIGCGPEPDSAPVVVRARRVVFAMGPIFKAGGAFWEAALEKELVGKHYPSDRILHPPEIVPYLMARNAKSQQDGQQQVRRLLIVGGGITSAQLALSAAKAPWCSSVQLIQRSRGIARHFDIENKWMGPRRGQLLDDFWALNMPERAQLLQDARLGGSIPPEILKDLLHCSEEEASNGLEVKEEVEISNVHWNGHELRVTLDDGSDTEGYDMIWLATGCENHLDSYSVFSHLRDVLPVDVVNGLPVLDKRLSWRRPHEEATDESTWKMMARKRLWCMGALAGLELGPDALNLIGARQGAVRVATAIRYDMMDTAAEEREQ